MLKTIKYKIVSFFSRDVIHMAVTRVYHQMIDIITNDEDFNFNRMKLNRDKKGFKIETPTKENPEAITELKSFTGVILYFERILSEDPEAVELRRLTILRSDRLMPEQIYLSKSSFYNWKLCLQQFEAFGGEYSCHLVKFTTEVCQTANSQFRYLKLKPQPIRRLKRAEREYIKPLAEVVRARMRREKAA